MTACGWCQGMKAMHFNSFSYEIKGNVDFHFVSGQNAEKAWLFRTLLYNDLVSDMVFQIHCFIRGCMSVTICTGYYTSLPVVCEMHTGLGS